MHVIGEQHKYRCDMTAIISKPDTQKKLQILSNDSQYDLACACSSSTRDEHRKRSADGKWVYPVTLPNGGMSVLLKTLISNVCHNDCKYCPLREDMDVQRCSLASEEVVKVFMDYFNRRIVHGIFLSAGKIGSADATMEKLNSIARVLRKKHKFRGYIHLKVIPGASRAAIAEAVSLSSAVSLNIETAGEKNMKLLSDQKDYIKDIIEPMRYISELTAKGSRYQRVKQTTQFIVGAANETDNEIVKYMGGLYDRLNLQRVYFSAYQRGLGDESIPGERFISAEPGDILTREHRLYQVDFLLRRYKFKDSDIFFDRNGNLSLDSDPKENWANMNPGFFPLDVNRAGYYDLLKVPGLGPVTVKRICDRRKQAKLARIEDIGKPGKLLRKAANYIRF